MGDEEAAKEQTTAEKLLFYITASFVLLGTFSMFAFLFLVPFVIEPAITTITMEFSETAAACATVYVESARGASNCSWTSCKEGCTKDVFECTQVLVNYRIAAGDAGVRRARVERAIREYDYPDAYPDAPPDEEVAAADGGLVSGLAGNGSEWFYVGAKLFPNVKGCGYPPSLNCSVWYKAHAAVGTNFSCYYSRVDPGLVISELDMAGVYANLVYATAIPIPSFIVSVVYLTIAYFYIYHDESAEPVRRPPRRFPLGQAAAGAAAEAAAAAAAEANGGPQTPLPPPTSGALTPASEVFREDLASFGHQLKMCMADDMSRESVLPPDSLHFLNSVSVNGNLSKMMTTSILTPPGPIADV